MAFKRAVKTESKLRMALAGPAGSGKTYTALLLAAALSDGEPFAVIDTERGSASKYSDVFTFDVLELDTFSPDTYVQAIHEAVQAGYKAVVIDSLSHAWNGKGGILEIVQRKNNGIKAWAEVKPIENKLIDTMTGARIHLIATMRTKTEYVVEQDERGKSAPRKVGTAPVQRDGLEYEFDVFGELDITNTLTINKSRCPKLSGAVINKPGLAVASDLKAWLSGAPMPVPAPEPAKPAKTAVKEPEEEFTFSVAEPSATQEQMDAIAKACRLLGCELPEVPSADEAEKILATLREEYKQRKQADLTKLGPVRV